MGGEEGGGGSGFNIYHMFADSIVFEQLFIFADSRWGGAGGKWIGHFFVDVINGWPLIQVTEWILLLNRIPEMMIQVIQGYKKKTCSVYMYVYICKYNVNVILNKFLCWKCLLFGVYKYLIYRFYIAAQFVT